jgi:hypothetical protein
LLFVLKKNSLSIFHIFCWNWDYNEAVNKGIGKFVGATDFYFMLGSFLSAILTDKFEYWYRKVMRLSLSDMPIVMKYQLHIPIQQL